MRLELDFTPLDEMFDDINRQSVVVGVLDKSIKSAKADYSKPVTTLSTASGSTKRRFVKTKGRAKNITLRRLAFILDAKKGIFSDVLINAENKELIEIAKLFAVPAKSKGQINQLRNIARALVRNPILRKDYNPNKASYVKRKGFNHWGLATGALFNNIQARYFER